MTPIPHVIDIHMLGYFFLLLLFLSAYSSCVRVSRCACDRSADRGTTRRSGANVSWRLLLCQRVRRPDRLLSSWQLGELRDAAVPPPQLVLGNIRLYVLQTSLQMLLYSC